ncbi:S-adenosyl-L-methionine-dependent methyltransferase [Athelia psychrophila]|uniref:S-adenosyl-L-methionine-dependent methyltransferase n=1 Tax=Athelia psychrophila TaxID=1759441 RepID=A0A167VQH3_9AGAM|nr:S-adenosyl-L-methionine-dependent methyltransferase [Fibularhizoctonia sp. CBS 109695]
MDTMTTTEESHSHTHTHIHRYSQVHLELQVLGGEAQEHDYSRANKNHYDDLEAEKMDERADANMMGTLVGEVMLGAYPFSDEETVVMDFACGTGIISRQLASSTRRIVGVDISEAMVRRYNLRADWQGLKPEEMHAECTDLEESSDGLNGELFDVIVCASSYHHFNSIEPVTRTLVSFLKPGGALMVTDMAQNAANTEIIADPHAHIVAHRNGFSPAEMEAVFTAAGLVDVVVIDQAIQNVKVHGQNVDIFLAKGVKPSSSGGLESLGSLAI